MEQRKVQGPEWELQVKQTYLLLGQPNLHRAGSSWGWGVAGRRHTCKKKEARWIEASSFGSIRPHAWGCIFLACQITPSCNTGPLLQIFAAERQNQRNYTLPQHIWCRDSDLTWLKQPRFDPHKAEAKHSRSPTWRKLSQWKLNAKKIQFSESDKKPSMPETRTAITNLASSSHGSVSDSSRPPVKVEGPCSYGWKDI